MRISKGRESTSSRCRAVLLVVLLGLLLPWSCRQAEDSGGGSEPIVLAALYNLSGAAQEGLDLPSSQGAQLAVDQANRQGGVRGRQVQLVVEDGQSSSAVLKQSVADVLQRHPSVSAFMGLSDTDMVLAAAPEAAAAGRLFLTSGATSPKLPSQVPDYLYLACFGDNVQAAAAAEWAYNDRSARTAAVVYDSSRTYTNLLQGYFTARFTELGGRIVSRQAFTPQDVEAVQQGLQPADIVFLSAELDEVDQAIRLLREAGVTGPILGGDGFDSEELWQSHPEVSNVFFTTHAYLGNDNEDLRVAAFREAFQQAYPDSPPDAFAALGYDTARLLLAALEKAEDDSPQAVLAAMGALGTFQGVTGDISYPSGSRIPAKSVSILEVGAGRVKLVRQLVPAGIPAP